MSTVVYAELTEQDRARLAAQAKLAADLARFLSTKACPEYLRGSASKWLEVTR